MPDDPNFYIAIVTTIGVIFAVVEYYRAMRNRKIDIALDALRQWEQSLTIHTGPVISLLRQHRGQKHIYKALKRNQSIELDGDDHKMQSYGYLIGDDNVIPAETVSELRIALYHYLNTWELIAEAYTKNRAHKKTIEAHLVEDRSYEDMRNILVPFMASYKNGGWTPLRKMLDKFDKP